MVENVICLKKGKKRKIMKKLEKKKSKPKKNWIPFLALGPPKKYKDKNELKKAIHSYFMQCRIHSTIPTIGGLALNLGIHRTTLLNYEKNEEKYEGYAEEIKHAREIICAYNEQLIYHKEFYQSAKFTLENNFEGFDASQKSKNENYNINTSYEEYIKKVEDNNEY